MDKAKLIEKITDIINSNFGDNNILKGSPEYAIKELTKLLTSLTAPVPDGKEELMCMERNCKEKATVDYNGHGHWVCKYHYDSLSRYFEEEYD